MTDYPNMRRVSYDLGDEGKAIFVPVCSTCGRFVTADGALTFDRDGQPAIPNAVCKRCGPTAMIWEGYL